MRLCLWNEPPWQLPRDFCRVHGFFSPVGQALPAAAGQSEELMLASHEGCFCSWERPSCGDGITPLPPTLQWVSSHSAIDLVCDAQDFSFYLKLRGKSVSESEMALLYEERIIYWRCWNQHLWFGVHTPPLSYFYRAGMCLGRNFLVLMRTVCWLQVPAAPQTCASKIRIKGKHSCVSQPFQLLSSPTWE